MSPYFVYNTTQKKYVAQPGQKSSFTKDILQARRFTSREAAQADCCGDEIVISNPLAR